MVTEVVVGEVALPVAVSPPGSSEPFFGSSPQLFLSILLAMLTTLVGIPPTLVTIQKYLHPSRLAITSMLTPLSVASKRGYPSMKVGGSLSVKGLETVYSLGTPISRTA